MDDNRVRTSVFLSVSNKLKVMAGLGETLPKKYKPSQANPKQKPRADINIDINIV